MLILLDTRLNDIHWSRPVVFEVAPGTVRRIKGPMDALNVLVHDSAVLHEDACAEARSDCCSALHHHKSLEEARSSFIAAILASRLKMESEHQTSTLSARKFGGPKPPVKMPLVAKSGSDAFTDRSS